MEQGLSWPAEDGGSTQPSAPPSDACSPSVRIWHDFNPQQVHASGIPAPYLNQQKQRYTTEWGSSCENAMWQQANEIGGYEHRGHIPERSATYPYPTVPANQQVYESGAYVNQHQQHHAHGQQTHGSEHLGFKPVTNPRTQANLPEREQAKGGSSYQHRPDSTMGYGYSMHVNHETHHAQMQASGSDQLHQEHDSRRNSLAQENIGLPLQNPHLQVPVGHSDSTPDVTATAYNSPPKPNEGGIQSGVTGEFPYRDPNRRPRAPSPFPRQEGTHSSTQGTMPGPPPHFRPQMYYEHFEWVPTSEPRQNIRNEFHGATPDQMYGPQTSYQPGYHDHFAMPQHANVHHHANYNPRFPRHGQNKWMPSPGESSHYDPHYRTSPHYSHGFVHNAGPEHPNAYNYPQGHMAPEESGYYPHVHENNYQRHHPWGPGFAPNHAHYPEMFSYPENRFESPERIHDYGGYPPQYSVRQVSDLTVEKPEYDEQSLRTVQVHGSRNLTDENVYVGYFAGVLECAEDDVVARIDKETKVVYVTFKSRQAAEYVSTIQQRKINGDEVEVSLVQVSEKPLPVYTNKLLFRNIPENTTRKVHEDHLEHVTGIKPCRLRYGDEAGVVLASFPTKLDFIGTQQRCASLPLMGKYLSVYRVHLSKAVLAEGLPDDITEESVKIHFQRETAHVERVVMLAATEHGARCIVHFVEHDALHRILGGRPQGVRGKTLNMEHYFEILGSCGGSSDPTPTIPKPLYLDELDTSKVKFLQRSSSVKVALNARLSEVYTKFTVRDGMVSLTCCVKPDTPNAHELVKTWSRKARKTFDDVFNNIKRHEMIVRKHLWPDFMKKVREFEKRPSDDIQIIQRPEESMIVLIGKSENADRLLDELQRCLGETEREAEFLDEFITEKHNNLRQFRLQLLNVVDFPSQTKARYEDLHIEINLQEKAMVFSGKRREVQQAVAEMQKSLGSVISQKITSLSSMQKDMLRMTSVHDRINKELRQRKLKVFWEQTKEKDVRVCAFNEADITRAVNIIRRILREECVDAPHEFFKFTVNTREWQSELTNMKQDFGNVFGITACPDTQKISIVGLDTALPDIKDRVLSFIQETTVFSQRLQLSPSRQKLVSNFFSKRIKEIEESLREYKISIYLDNDDKYMEVRGTTKGLECTREELEALGASIAFRKVTVTDQLKLMFLTSTPIEDLEALGQQHKCVISREEEAAGIKELDSSAADDTPGTTVHSTSYKGVTVAAVLGDITEMEVDVMVNAANGRMNHTGGLAKNIVEKGGKSIQDECDAKLAGKDELPAGSVLVSGSGNLPCKTILHAVGPHYGSGRSGEDACLKQVTTECLKKAVGMGYKSIAIPAISSGIFGFPIEPATRIIVQAVRDFIDNESSQGLAKIFLCHVDETEVQCFVNALREAFPEPTISGRERTADSSRTSTYRLQGSASVEVTALDTRLQSTLARLRDLQPPVMSKPKVRIIRGEIAQQKADVLVNSVAPELDLSKGNVSNSMLKAAGTALQAECTQKYPDGIKIGQIAITGGHGLDCQRVFHVALGNWSDTNSRRVLDILLTKCLEAASKLGATSIVFPVLGTGVLRYPRKDVAESMLDAMYKYCDKATSTSLKTIVVVVYQKDFQTIEEFQKVYELREKSRASAIPSPFRRGTSVERSSRRFPGDMGPVTLQTDAGFTSEPAAYEILPSGLQFVVKQGDITKEAVRAIVNSSNQSLDLSQGAVAKAIRKLCGEKLEKECQQKVAEMKSKGIVVTGSYSLPSTFIIHLDSSRFQSDWEKGVLLILEEAEKQGIQSVAMPALGTGAAYNVKPEQSAKMVIQAVMKFSEQKPKALKSVYIVIFELKMIQPFVTAAETSGQNVTRKLPSLSPKHYGSSSARSRTPLMSLKGTHGQPGMNRETFFVYGINEECVDAAVTAFDKRVEDLYEKKEVKDSTLALINEKKVKEIGEICKNNSVDFELSQKQQVLVLLGLRKAVYATYERVQDILHKAELQRKDEEAAQTLATYIRWCILEIGKVGVKQVQYPDHQNLLIETAFRQNEKTVKLADEEGTEYIVDFEKMVEYPASDPSDTVRVVRKHLIAESTGTLPDTWSHEETDYELKMEPLPSSCAEYQHVEKSFMVTDTTGSNSVTEVFRIQNPTLYRQYTAKKCQLDKQNGPLVKNERTLWHGTSSDAVGSINMYGFNRSYCGKNAVAYGQGVYFAVDPSYSRRTTYSPPDDQGKRYIYQCKVLVGHTTKGKEEMRVLPKRTGDILYDSATDNEQSPGMYVVFNDTQAYPEYLIIFK